MPGNAGALGGRVRSLDGEDLLEKDMATHSSTLAWKIPWIEEPGGLQSMGLQRVRTQLSDFTFTFTSRLVITFLPRSKRLLISWLQSLSVVILEPPKIKFVRAPHSSGLAWRIPGMGRAWWADICGAAPSWTRLKRLSSSSSVQ